MAPAGCSTRLACGLLGLLLLIGAASCTRQDPAGVEYGSFSHHRRVLQNPDLPSQRDSNPSWMNGGSSGGGGSSSGGGSGPQQATYASSPIADVHIYNGGSYGANWIDSSYGVRPFTQYSPAGHTGGVAKCSILPYGAATSFFDKSAGDFTGRRALELFVYRGSSDAAMPDITIALAGPSTACASSIHFSSLLPSADVTASGWVKFWVPLDSVFGGGSAGGGAFQGCPASDGSYLSSGSVVKIDLRNDNSGYDALVCVDDVRLAA